MTLQVVDQPLVGWDAFDTETKKQIFSHLEIPDLIGRCLSVCKEWHGMINRTDFWESFVQRVVRRCAYSLMRAEFFPDVVRTIVERLFINHPVPIWPYRRNYEIPLAMLASKINRLGFVPLEMRPDLAANLGEGKFLIKNLCGKRVVEIVKNSTFDSDTKIGMIRTILTHCAITTEDMGGAVYLAARNGQQDLVAGLLKIGPIENYHRSLAILEFADKGKPEAVQLLLKSGPIEENELDLRGQSVVAAAQNRDTDMVQNLLQNGSITGSKAIEAFKLAVLSGNPRMARIVMPTMPWKKIAMGAAAVHAIGVGKVMHTFGIAYWALKALVYFKGPK